MNPHPYAGSLFSLTVSHCDSPPLYCLHQTPTLYTFCVRGLNQPKRIKISAVIRDLDWAELRIRTDVIVAYCGQRNADPCARMWPFRNLLLLHLYIYHFGINSLLLHSKMACTFGWGTCPLGRRTRPRPAGSAAHTRWIRRSKRCIWTYKHAVEQGYIS